MRYHAVVLVVAGAIAYATSFSGPLLFDDQAAIVRNAQIRTVSPLSVPLSPPRDTAVAARPLANLTLAFDYAMGGLDVTSYHVTNLTIHLLVALALLAVLRRSLRTPVVPASLQPHADGLALAAALVWTLHPLNTEVVDYVARRTMSLMALAYVLTLYCAIRAHARPRRWGWRIAAVVACGAGMACDGAMVTAPLMVMLYDRFFLYPGFRAALRERWVLYAGLAITWGGLGALLIGRSGEAAGFASNVSPWTYLLGQAPVVARYLWLSVWPRALVLDYGPAGPVTTVDAIVAGALLGALVLGVLALLRWRPLVGFLGLWFLVTLAPTSGLVPMTGGVGAESRMYLPLMAVVVLAVVGIYRLLATRGLAGGRVPVAATAMFCLLLGAGTLARTQEYQSARSLAQTVVDRRPNGRARVTLARELIVAGQHDAALRELEAAITDYPPAHLTLAMEMMASGRLEDAVTHARDFVRLLPDDADVPAARKLLGRALALQGRYDAAAEQLALAARARPDDPEALVSMGGVRLRQRRFAESIASYESALQMQPGDPEILGELGMSYAAAGRMSDASAAFERAASARPNDVRFLNLWGRTLVAGGRYADALVPLRRLVEVAPSDPNAAQNLAIIEGLAARQGAGGGGKSVEKLP